MSINENCEKYLKCLREYTKDINTRYTTRRISFFNRDIVENMYSLGYVETVSQNDNGSIFSEDEHQHPQQQQQQQQPNEEKYETLEMQLKQVPRRNPSSFTRKNKHLNGNGGGGPGTIQNQLVKYHPKARSKSIIDIRNDTKKNFLSFNNKVIGSEGEENSEFKHPLGMSLLNRIKYYVLNFLVNFFVFLVGFFTTYYLKL